MIRSWSGRKPRCRAARAIDLFLSGRPIHIDDTIPPTVDRIPAGHKVGFVGRNQKLQMDQNLKMFEEVFIPLLKEAKARGIEYRVEQCPMPGWTTLAVMPSGSTR
jgi:hypothetical protein